MGMRPVGAAKNGTQHYVLAVGPYIQKRVVRKQKPIIAIMH